MKTTKIDGRKNNGGHRNVGPKPKEGGTVQVTVRLGQHLHKRLCDFAEAEQIPKAHAIEKFLYQSLPE